MGMLGGTGDEDPDNNPYFIVAVVEVENTPAGSLKKLEEFGLPITVRHKWGSSKVKGKTAISRAIFLKSNGKPLPTVARRFEQEYNKVSKDNTPQNLDLAEWALTHGLYGKFVEVMDKLAEKDKENGSVRAYLKVKADLARPLAPEPAPASWRTKLIPAYKVLQDEQHHYALLHNLSSDADAMSYLNHLEDAYRGFYYWFARRGVVLPVPQQRLLAVLAGNEDEFKRYHKALTTAPVVGDGFFARRENVAVLSSRRLDEPYDALDKYTTQELWNKGYNRQEILKGGRSGIPRGTLPNSEEVADAQMLALLLKAMEHESELTSTSHDGSRQLLYASGLLPPNVAAPEWLLFGMGSFFETPPESPWAGTGAPSFYYLPRFKENKAKKFGANPYERLRRVITDANFRNLPAPGPEREAAVRKARTAAWALGYFLAQQKLEGLFKYFKELSRMPRDMELDDQMLLGAFARAFDCVDANKKIDVGRLRSLADQWDQAMTVTTLESEDILQEIRKYYKEMTAKPAQGAQPGGPGAPPP
jgi:hypothetical protein